MGWNTNASSGGSNERPAFIQEGNLDIMLFSEEKQRITFLTQDVDVEAVMSQNQLTREQATEYIYTEMAREIWVNPYDYWSHDVPSISGQRFFSTIACQGRQTCPLCMENDKAKNNGVSENKHLPFPVKKKYLAPVWHYGLGRVLFIRQTQQFMDQIGDYLNQFGSAIDFNVWKTGRGYNTNNLSMYLGPRGADFPQGQLQIIAPKDIDFGVTQEEISKKTGLNSASAQASQSQQMQQFQAQMQERQAPLKYSQFAQQSQGNTSAQPANQSQNVPIGAGNFVIPFGIHKGKTLETAYQEDPETIKFFRDKGNGLVQSKSSEYLSSIGV